MIRFLDGPADGVALDLRRTPILLRVVFDPKKGWDALDQLGDVPTPNEWIYLYQITGQATIGFIDYRGKGGRRTGEQFAIAQYRQFVDDPPTEAVMRNDVLWDAWCTANKERVMTMMGGAS